MLEVAQLERQQVNKDLTTEKRLKSLMTGLYLTQRWRILSYLRKGIALTILLK